MNTFRSPTLADLIDSTLAGDHPDWPAEIHLDAEAATDPAPVADSDAIDV